MSAPEIGYRVRQRFQTERERLNWWRHPAGMTETALWTGLGRPASPDWEAWARDCENRAILSLWPEQATRPSNFIGRYPGEAERLVASADAVLSGRLSFFGHLDVPFDDPFDWHRDPVTGRQWPGPSFYADVDFRWGGAKTIWEAARHQHLVTLAQAYWLTGKERYQEGITRHLSSWLQQNPPYCGIHWTSGLELGLRLISWLWVYLLTRGRGFSPWLWREWTRATIAQGDYLAQHLSKYSSANNHLTGEACGLLLAGLMAPEWHESRKWQAQGLEILEQEIVKQILPDGGPAEQAAHYHGFVLDFYLLLGALAQRGIIRLSDATIDRLAAAGDFLLGVMDAQGNLPAFGDEDGGQAFILADDDANLTRSRLATMAVICNRPEFKSAAGGFGAGSWWLLGEAGADIFAALPESGFPRISQAFEDSGYWTLRSKAFPPSYFVWQSTQAAAF